MPKPLSHNLQPYLQDLKQLGQAIDQQYAQWREQMDDDEQVLALSKLVSQAHQAIAGLVLQAEQEQQLAHPTLVGIKRDWQQRFEQLEARMSQAQSEIAHTLSASTKRHRAADAYLKNQR